MIRTETHLKLDDGSTVALAIWRPAVGTCSQVLVFLPGLKGFIKWGSFPYVCDALCTPRRIVLSIGFSCDGAGLDAEITRPELAIQNSVTREINETMAVLKMLKRGAVDGIRAAECQELVLMGHSLGGLVALKTAQECDEPPAAVVTWSSISHLDLWPAADVAKWAAEGRFNRPNARTGQDFFLGRDFLTDVQNTKRFDLRRTFELRCPLLIVHGDQDTSVPMTQAHELYKAAGRGAELAIIKGGDHNYGAVHPFHGSTSQLDEALKLTSAWLDSKLR